MFTEIHPKLPMRNKAITRDFYVNAFGFEELGDPHFMPYLMLRKDGIELHFFEHKNLNPLENYGQIYIRTLNIDALYSQLHEKGVAIHPNGSMQIKPWGQKEFSLLDPDHNLLTIGEKLDL